MSRTKIIIVLLIINAITCFIFRVFIHRGRLKILDFASETNETSDVSILLAGIFNQPYGAFFLLPAVKSDHMIFCDYSCFGFNAKNAGKQINAMDIPSPSRVNVYAISLGDKVARYLTRCTHIYGINPCPNPSVLRTNWQKILPPVALSLEIITLALGWIAVIPLVPSDDTCYSIALISDQLWEISINRSTPPDNKGITSLVLSSKDEYIDDFKLWRFYKHLSMPEVTIDSKHGRTMDLAWSAEYNRALEELQQRR